jgi:acetylornithine/N-succinyldiaminopimelate aminotransferase
MTEQATLLDQAQCHLYPNYQQSPFVLCRGQGSQIWDMDGKRYLDLCAGIAVNTLGHAHPRLVHAISEQAAQLMHVSNYFYNEPNIKLAIRLCELSGYSRAFFCNSGTEAVEMSLKLARRHFTSKMSCDRYRVIAFENSFHGRTLGSLAATGQAKYRDGFGPLLGVTHVPYGDSQAVRANMGPDVAAILVEPIQGEGGIITAPEGFLRDLRQIADEQGALLIADEVQTGLGRTGHFLACAHSNVEPDIVTLAKGLGGGFPIGAVLCNESLSADLPPGSHGTTFGGNPLASRAALTVLDVIVEEELIAAARVKGELLGRLLGELKLEFSKQIVASRGRGLLWAVELDPSLEVSNILEHCRNAGLLLTRAGSNALRFSPSLTVLQSELEEGVRLLAEVLKAEASCVTC